MLKYFGIGLISALLLSGGSALAQQFSSAPVLQPQSQPGAGQSFIYRPGATAGSNRPSLSTSPLGGPAQGLVTGYGPGGLGQAPGSPPNSSFVPGFGSPGARPGTR